MKNKILNLDGLSTNVFHVVVNNPLRGFLSEKLWKK